MCLDLKCHSLESLVGRLPPSIETNFSKENKLFIDTTDKPMKN